MSEARTIRPGYLVSMKSSISGNVQTDREVVEARHTDENGYEVEKSLTTHIVIDPAEQAEAIKLRGKIRGLVTGICTASAFGLLCPLSRREELQEAVAKGREMAWEFNRKSKFTQIRVNVIYGLIAQDDFEAVQAISGELRDLMAEMEDGLKNLDIKKVRDAAQKANDTGQMLSVDAKLRVDEAVKAARAAARKISKAGEAAAQEISVEALKTLAGARTSFLDIDIDQEVQSLQAEEGVLTPADAPDAEFDFSSWDEEPAEPDTPPITVEAPITAVVGGPAPAGPDFDIDIDNTEEN